MHRIYKKRIYLRPTCFLKVELKHPSHTYMHSKSIAMRIFNVLNTNLKTQNLSQKNKAYHVLWYKNERL